jgi:hypothetical protein
VRPALVETGPETGACPPVPVGLAIPAPAPPSRYVPDVALVAAWVTLFYCLFLFQGYQKLFRDSDAGWHIRSGEAILASGSLPRTDPYSFTAAGRAWCAWEWGADVLTGGVHRAGGLGAVALLYAMAIAAGVWLWFRLHWALGGNFLVACAMAPLLLSTCNIHWLARPHVFSWLFLVAAVIYLERPRDRFGLAGAAVPAIATALWANVHASFLLAPALAALYAAGAWLRPLLWNLNRREEWRRARWYALTAMVSALASLLNPYGWNLHRHVFHYLTDADLLSRIGEFQSFDFHAAGAGQIAAAVLLSVAGGALALQRKELAHFALAFGLAAVALRSARALPLAALLLLPVANAGIAAWLRTAGDLAAGVRQGLDRFLAYSDNLRRHDSRFSGWAVAWVVPVLLFGLLRAPSIAARTGFPPADFPVAACATIDRLPPDSRLFAPDKFGGYLIYRYRGARKVFFDGRSDLYGAAFLKSYARLVQVRPGWRERFAGYRFTHALLPDGYSLVPALQAIGWHPIYRDSTATVLESPPIAVAGDGTK